MGRPKFELPPFWFEREEGQKSLPTNLPEPKETERVRAGLLENVREKADPYAQTLQWFFATSRIQLGSLVTVGGRALFFEGAYAEMDFPQAMIFFDPSLRRHVQFYGEILSPVKIFTL
jgi:hypothetical protein